MGYDVRCPVCLDRCLETNDNYDPDEITNGTMVDLKPNYRMLGWQLPFVQLRETIFTHLLCPSCGAVLPGPTGKVTVIKPVEEIDLGGTDIGALAAKIINHLHENPRATPKEIWRKFRPWKTRDWKSMDSFVKNIQKPVRNLLDLAERVERDGGTLVCPQ